jgi:hypothetical protein
VDAEREFWMAYRRALLDLIRAIERRYGMTESKPTTH